MIPLIIINIIAVLLVYLSKNNKTRNLYNLAFFILVVFYGIRYDYGKDYATYMDVFNMISSYRSVSFLVGGHYEIGWLFLNFVFSKTSFYLFVFVLTIIQFLPVYILLKKYVEPEYRFVGLFVFLFSASFLISLSMMRQSLAISLIMLSLPLLEKKKTIPLYLLAVLFAAQFHTTAYIMVIIPFLLFLSNLDRNKMLWLYLFLLFAVVLFSSSIQALFEYVYEFEEMDRYHGYQNDDQYMTFGVGFLIHLLYCFCIIKMGPLKPTSIRLYSLLYPISYAFTVLSMIFGGVARLSLYFSGVYFVAFPFLLNKFKKNSFLYLLLVLVILLDFWSFITFFYLPVYSSKYLVYHTIFDIL